MLTKFLVALFLLYEAQCFKYFNVYFEKHDIDNAEEMFKEFLEATEMNFTGDEYYERFAVFTENLKRVNNMNARNGSAKFGITKWSHLTPEEFKERIRCIPDQKKPSATEELITDINDDDDYNIRDLPSSKDWRDKLPPVKDQNPCGTCWIFSAVGAIEGQYANLNNEVISLSEQQVQDCTTGNCNEGGWPDKVFKYVNEFGGIMADKDYPYIRKNQTCRANISQVVARVTDYTPLSSWTEQAMTKYVAETAPLSISIDATMMMGYIGGIMEPHEGECGDNVNHAVLITGYSDEEKDHWVIRNSWGEKWGENGYFRIVRNQRACSIGNYVTTVSVAKN